MNPNIAPLVVGVTSHRNIAADEWEPIRLRVRDFFARLQREFPHLPLVVLSALAEGGDQLAAEEALAVDAQLIATLPMPREQYADDFTDAAALARFDALCDGAPIIHVGGVRRASRGAASGLLEGKERDLHYAQAGMYISDHCHILLAIWDGKGLGRLGGTAQIATYHLTGERPGHAELEHPDVRNLFGSRSERLAYHVVCSRDQDDGKPELPLQPLQLLWRAGRTQCEGTRPMPDTFRYAFERMDEFNLDTDHHRASIAAHAGLAAQAGLEPDAAGRIDEAFRRADWLAVHFQRRVLVSMRALYTLAALMGIAFTVYDNVPQQDGMLYVFLLLFALGGVIVFTANRRGWHRKFLDYRALAEGLRVQFYWEQAGISLASVREFPSDNFLQKQDVELRWVRDVMRALALDRAIEGRQKATVSMAEVIDDWVGNGTQGGQLGYYTRKAAQRARTHRVTEAIGIAALCVGIAISIALAVLARQLSPDAKNELVMTMAVFSIVGGVRSAYAFKKADKELIKQYRYMQNLFTEARGTLDRAAGADERRDILRLLGEAALTEQVEWALMHRQRPLEHNRL